MLTSGTCLRGGTLHIPLLEVLTAQMLHDDDDRQQVGSMQTEFLELHNFQNFGWVACETEPAIAERGGGEHFGVGCLLIIRLIRQV